MTDWKAGPGLPEDGVAYRDLADALRSAIAGGDFSEGRRLPTEAELVARFQVSRQTVRRALQDLVAEGLVFRVRGRGTFVAHRDNRAGYLRSVGSVEDLLSLSRDAVWITVKPLELRSDIESASRLRQDSDQVYNGTFMRRHEDRILSVSRIYLPSDVGRKIVDRGLLVTPEEISDRTIVSWVEEVNESPIAMASQSITASPMPEDCVNLLEAAPNSWALRIDRLYFDSDGRAVELAVSFFDPGRYTYRIELHRNASLPTLQAEALPKT